LINCAKTKLCEN